MTGLPDGPLNCLRILWRMAFSRRGAALVIVAALTVVVGGAPAAAAAGSAFSVIGTPSLGADNTNNLVSIADISPAEAWAVGNTSRNGPTAPLVEEWQAGRWHVMNNIPVPIAGQAAQFTGVVAPSPTSVWAVGYAQNQEGSTQPLVEHWDGSGWGIVTTEATSTQSSNTLNAIGADTPGDVWAVGTFQNPNGTQQTLVERWQGSGWNIIQSPDPNPQANAEFTTVAPLTPTDVWAAGYSVDQNSGNEVPLTEMWNGTAWSIVPFPVPTLPGDATITSLAVENATDIWAVGNATTGQATASFIAHFNGTAWSLLPTPVDGLEQQSQLNDIAITSATTVIAVGSLGNQPLIEQWNGSSFSVATAPSAGDTGQYVFEAAAASSASDIWVVGNGLNSLGNEQPVVAHAGPLPSPPPGTTSCSAYEGGKWQSTLAGAAPGRVRWWLLCISEIHG